MFYPSSGTRNVDSFDNPAIPLEIIPFIKETGARNMKKDESLALNPPDPQHAYLRFYGWEPFCLSLGYHQDSGIINKKRLADNGFHWIKRPTGGRAIFHAEELTYCAVFPKTIITAKHLYKILHTCIAKAMQLLGYDVQLAPDDTILPRISSDMASDSPCFTKPAPTEIRMNGKKIVGSAQRVYPLTILQHGSILIGTKHKSLPQFLQITEEERNTMAAELDQKTICLNEVAAIPKLKEKLMNGILKQLELSRICYLNYY